MQFENPISISAYDPQWVEQFQQIGRELRQALGSRALRIDHIGSTAVPGLTAKPIIDVQVSVLAFDPLLPLAEAIETLGYVYNPNNPDLTKRYFRDAPDGQHVQIHVRLAGSWSEQFALLFRDYLRAQPAAATEYIALKQHLANEFGDDRLGYTEAKSDFIFRTIAKAHAWSMANGWQPGKSDA